MAWIPERFKLSPEEISRKKESMQKAFELYSILSTTQIFNESCITLDPMSRGDPGVHITVPPEWPFSTISASFYWDPTECEIALLDSEGIPLELPDLGYGDKIHKFDTKEEVLAEILQLDTMCKAMDAFNTVSSSK